MPTASNRRVDLYYETAGSGETVAFVEDAGLGAWSWGWQHAALAGPFETLVWDSRGTGRSARPGGPYAVDAMAADLEAVLADHGVRSAHLVGLGLGGAVALRYAREYGRAASLVLAGTAADPGTLQPDVRECLLDPDPAAALPVLLSEAFRDDHPDAVDRIVEWRREEDADPEATGWQLDAAAGFDATGWLHEVTVPALVLHGSDDGLWPVEAGRRLADGLPRGELEAYDGAGHLVTVERSRPVNDALVGFLESQAD